MTPDYNLCDICHAKVSRSASISLFSSREPDGAGAMENTYCSYDLCQTCLTSFVEHIENKYKSLFLGKDLECWVLAKQTKQKTK